jgi:trichothecene 3-O-acetyltransferase
LSETLGPEKQTRNPIIVAQVKETLQLNHIAMNSGVIHTPLTPLDHLPPGNYTCSVSYLSLKSGISHSQAFEILQEGLHKTFMQLPWLSGRVWPQSSDAPGWRPGQLEIRHSPVYQDRQRPHQLKLNKLNTSTTFGELRDSAFPTDCFSDEELIWVPFMVDINTGPEVVVAQANFIRGGCLLTGAIHHAVSDGTGFFYFLQLWASHCRAIQSAKETISVSPPPLDTYDRTVLRKIWEREGRGRSPTDIDSTTWRLLGLDPQSFDGRAILLDQSQPNDSKVLVAPQKLAKSAIFYLSPANLIALQKDCAQFEGTMGTAISVNDALCALIWRSISKARAGASKFVGNRPSNVAAQLGMAVDARPDFSQSLPIGYFGNLTVLNQSSVSLSLLTSPTFTLGSVARKIREGANMIDSQSLLDAYCLASSIKDFNELVLRTSSHDSISMLITSLIMFPLNAMNFGDQCFGNGGQVEAFRPLMGAFNRFIRIAFVLPRVGNGGVEFIANMYDEEMELLLADEEFGKYAMFLA